MLHSSDMTSSVVTVATEAMGETLDISGTL